MTTETTDPLEQAVMEAAEEFHHAWDRTTPAYGDMRERLRLHVQLAILKAKQQGASAGGMMAEHAPEPWRFDLAGTGRRGDSKIVAVDDVIIGRTYDYDQRDARRIVACVNACKEWDTETLEAWAADPTSPLLANQLAQLQRDLAAARAEAARYRAALERLCRCSERDPDDGVCLAHHVLNGGNP